MNRLLFHNGLIRTMDTGRPVAEALLVEETHIRAVGRYADLAPAVEGGGTVIDLKGKTLMPGFNDAHIHIWKVGQMQTHLLDLRGVGSILEVKEKLEAFAGRTDSPWIIGRGFNEAKMTEGRLPDRQDLDAVITDRPVFLIRTCAHIGVANSRALEQAGIRADTPAPPGGRIEKDKRGIPTGLLSETALGLVLKKVPPPTADDYRKMVRSAGEVLLQAGITSATDPAVMPDLMAVYRDMDATGALPVRVNTLAVRLPGGGEKALPLPERYQSDWLRVEGVKFFADGGLSGQTAALRQPYRNSRERGVLRLEANQFFQLAAEAHQRGFRIGTHAIGDEAIELALNVYQRLYETSGPGKAHRIEHLGLPDKRQLKRMQQLGLIAVPQAIFLRELGLNFRKYLPTHYLRRCYPLRSVLDQGIPLALSSDAPVVKDFNPLSGMAAAVERIDETGRVIAPEECISLREALEAYTKGGALAAGEDIKKGVLKAGRLADMIILNKDPMTLQASTLPHVKVERTFIGGSEK